MASQAQKPRYLTLSENLVALKKSQKNPKEFHGENGKKSGKIQ